MISRDHPGEDRLKRRERQAREEWTCHHCLEAFLPARAGQMLCRDCAWSGPLEFYTVDEDGKRSQVGPPASQSTLPFALWLGKRITQARELRGISAVAMADAIGMGKSTVYRWETGECVPNAEALVHISRVLEVTPSELLMVKIDKARPQSTVF